MQRFHIVHELDGTPAAFWELFFDDAFNRAFYAAVDIDLEVLEDMRDERRIERVVRYRSTQPVPAIMRPFLPDGLGYVEHATFDRAAQRLEHRIEPTSFADRTDIRGVIRAEAIGAGRFRRVYEGTVEIRLAMLGARLEAATIASMQKSNDAAAPVLAAWLARGQKAA